MHERNYKEKETGTHTWGMRKQRGLKPSFLWLSQAEAVGLGWLWTLGFSFKARERGREKITVKK